MALPTSRDLTCTTGAVVPSSLLNSIQDRIIALHEGQRGSRVRIVGPEVFNVQTSWAINSAMPIHELNASTAGLMFAPLPVEVGHRIASVAVVAGALGNGSVCVASDITASLRRVNAAAGAGLPGSETTVIAATNLPSTAITMQKITLSSGGPFTVAADQHWFVRIAGANTAGGKYVARLEITYDIA